MKRIVLVTAILMLLAKVDTVKAQSDWEPQKRITGYIATEFNYFNKLEGYQNEYGVALSEAGILTSYQPTENLTFKAVFVYRPDFSFNQMLNEANLEYKASDNVNFKVGRFLTPLSPMNTYYYAPVNTSATLPVLVSNHEFFPLTMDALSINGSAGEDFKVSYDVFAGGYRNTTWMKTGAVGFFGDEVAYYKQLINSPYTIDQSYNNTYNVAAGGSVGLSYTDIAHVGFSAFKPKDETMQLYVPAYDIVQNEEAKKFTYGVNFKLKLNNTQLIGEVWNSDFNVGGTDIDLKGSFIQLSQALGKVTPFVRYEDQTTNDIEFQRYTGGLLYQPMFETGFKLEYIHYAHEVQDIDGVVLSFIYSF
ncbi:hypothetical protein [Labilibacter marinus]|uniref:hypothetical protein n=1 Tax=Labilibacter marinus TaxID=1477105 RepID=UPI00095017C8|nr:hypothetical protein [Labilibacter marinus]